MDNETNLKDKDRELTVDSLWLHYKGWQYIITALAQDASNNENKGLLVVYKKCGTNNYYVRPADEFLGVVEASNFYRFEKVGLNNNSADVDIRQKYFQEYLERKRKPQN